EGHSRLHQRAERLDGFQWRPAFVDLPQRPDQGHGRQVLLGAVVVRQRVGLLEPDGGYGRRDGEADLSICACASLNSPPPQKASCGGCWLAGRRRFGLRTSTI